jgi:hypothetical protein
MDGKDIFILCDTFWSALYNPTENEWLDYLRYRKMQGYNAVQFNALHQWDGGLPETGLLPFITKPDGTFDFYRYNEEYFDRAKRMVGTASEMGFIPIVFVLHASYVKGTWATASRPEYIMPYELVKPYAQKIAALFKEFNPIYIVAADTNFPETETKNYYMAALEGVKSEDPEGLCSFHLTPNVPLPDEFMNSEMIDFYCLQPGHNINNQDNMYKMINEYYNAPITRPVINDEFSYEGHSHTGEAYGRYGVFEQRKCIWQSILSGSTAGIAYGAHGLWGWHRAGKSFENSAYAGGAFTWQTALRFKGAWEGSFAKFIMERFNLFDIVPSDELLNENVNQRNEIRIAKTPDNKAIVIYVPYSVQVTLNNNYNGYKFTLIDMENKHFGIPNVMTENGKTCIDMYDFNGDALIIGEN